MSALLKRLRKEVELIPTNEQNWELFGAERIWANLMGNREGVPAKDQQLIKEACWEKNIYSFSQLDFLNTLGLDTLQAIARIVYQTDAHHVIRKRTDRINGAEDLLHQTKGCNNRHLLIKAIQDFLLLNRKESKRAEDTENRPPPGAKSDSATTQPPRPLRFSEIIRSNCEMDRTLTIIDLTFIIFASFFAPPREAFDEERLAIFLKMFLAIVHGLNPKRLLICLDSPTPLKKMEQFETYKETRRFDTRMHAHFDQVGEFLSKCKIRTLRQDGYEADDLVNSCAKQWISFNPVNQVAIVTSDKDFFQICSERIWVCKYQKEHRRYQLYRPADVLREFDVRPDQFVDYQCLVGDASDAIHGLDGVGKKTAVAMLKEHGTLLRIFQHAAAIGDAVLLSQYQRVFTNNQYLLTFLKPSVDDYVSASDIECCRFVLDEFSQWFSKYLNTQLPAGVRAEFARRNAPTVNKVDEPFAQTNTS